MDGRRLLSTKEVAQYTGYTPLTIYRALAAGELASVRRGVRAQHRFKLADIENWLTAK